MAWRVPIGNVAAVSLLISVWMHLHYRLYRLSAAQARMGFGLRMGIAALFSMLLSVEIDNGYYLDLRSTLLAVSAVYGGPLPFLSRPPSRSLIGYPWAVPAFSRV
jgi:hypothetical protein